MTTPRTTTASRSEAGAVQAALDLLGLRRGADEADVRAAFRRHARAHHPDRFQHLGPEAVARATPHFQALLQAYRLLLSRSGAPTAHLQEGLYRPAAQAPRTPYAAAHRPGARFDVAA